MELLTQLIQFTCNGSNYGHETMDDEKVEEVKVCHKYDADIEALAVFYSLEPGELQIQLQDLLLICPRKRHRNDAYQGLIGELGRRGVKLTIKNRKNK